MKVLLILICVGAAASMKCSVDRDVQFILKNFNPTAVSKNVDCVVGVGACDSLGTKLKDEAPDAVRSGKCGRSCTCNQIQVNLGWEHWTNNYTGAQSF